MRAFRNQDGLHFGTVRTWTTNGWRSTIEQTDIEWWTCEFYTILCTLSTDFVLNQMHQLLYVLYAKTCTVFNRHKSIFGAIPFNVHTPPYGWVFLKGDSKSRFWGVKPVGILWSLRYFWGVREKFSNFWGQTAEYVRFRRDLGCGKLKNLAAGVQKCPRGGLRGGQPPKLGQSLLKQEKNDLICFTSFLPFSSQVNSGRRHSKITSTSSNIK
jgi:hypothetical protein